MLIKKNDEIELEITGTSHDGAGVGRYESLVIFVPAAAQGDIIKAKILSVKKSLAFAKLLEVIRPSQARIPVDCPVFEKCGGCVFRHIGYEKELQIKKERVRDVLSKIGHIDMEPEEIVGMSEGSLDGYRNKAQFPVGYNPGGEIGIGFYAPRSHRIINCISCRLQPAVFEEVLKIFSRWISKNSIPLYDEVTGSGLLRHIYIRQAPATKEMMVCAVVNGMELPHANELIDNLRAASRDIVSIVININRGSGNAILGDRCVTLWGKDTITDVLCGLRFELSPLSFYQVNSSQAEKLYAIAVEFAGLSKTDTLLDLYCGTGTIGLTMAAQVKKLIGVEAVPQAVADAERNARQNGIANAQFICADAGRAAADFERAGLKPDVVVVDPPRKGCSAETIDAIVRMTPSRVIYISCDPATLARDLAIFTQKGYACRRLKAVDLFPRTAHVECVVLMTKCGTEDEN